MSFFANAFRAEMKKYKDPSMSSESTLPISYPTGFLPLDYMNGALVTNEIIDTGEFQQYESIGIGEGSINSLIGKSGTAKSTMAAQIAGMIISMFKDSVAIYDDVEGGMSLQRFSNVTGLSMRTIAQKVIHRNVGINAENFFERVNAHCTNKIQASITHPDKVTYFTGTYDYYGNPVYKLIPTVYILDSLALLVPKELSEEEKLKGQMATTAQAKANAQIFRRLAPKVKEANVILLVVNHINDKVNISFIPQQAQINYLGQNENIPGGFMSLYLSNNILKFTSSTKLTEDKGLGINGFMSKVKLVKSRNNRAGQEVNLVYDQNRGFDRILSCYEYLKENDVIRGAGSSFYIDGLQSIKFAQKNFYKKFYEEPLLREAMMQSTIETCRMMLPKFDESAADMSKNEFIKRLNAAFEDED